MIQRIAQHAPETLDVSPVQPESDKREDFVGRYEVQKMFDDVLDFGEDFDNVSLGIELLYVHCNRQDKAGEPIWDTVEKDLKRILDIDPSNYPDKDLATLQSQALWLLIDRYTREKKYENAIKLAEYFAEHAKAGKPVPELIDAKPHPDFKSIMDGRPGYTKADYWPMTWVEPERRTAFFQYLVAQHSPLIQQATGSIIRQVIGKGYARSETPEADYKAIQELHACAAQQAQKKLNFGSRGAPYKDLKAKMDMCMQGAEAHWIPKPAQA